MRAVAALVAVLTALPACTKVSEKYCALHGDDPRCAPRGDGGARCAVDDECSGDAPVCDVAAGSCVQCLPESAAACTGTTPTCEDTACRACRTNADCASALCLDDGSCADPTQVAYVTSAGASPACSLELPCGNLQAAEDTTRPYIKLTGSITDTAPVAFQSGTRTIFGDGATLSVGAANATMIELQGVATTLTIRGLTLTGATGSVGAVISSLENPGPQLVLDRVRVLSNAGAGLNVQGGKVTITRSIFARNATIGMRLENCDYQVSNTLIVQNGKVTVTIGGAFLAPATQSSRFELNTVADNITSANAAARIGVQCSNAPALTSSLVVGNTAGMCVLSYSGYDALTVPLGTNNTGSVDADFLEAPDPTSPAYYRIGVNSDAIGKASPATTLDIDIDGQPRPAGMADLGADQYVP